MTVTVGYIKGLVEVEKSQLQWLKERLTGSILAQLSNNFL